MTSVLTLWRFSHLRSLGSISYVPSFELWKDEKSLLECDLLLMISGNFSGNAEVILVESKSENDLEQKDIDKILALEKLIGIPCFKCFSTTKETFSEDELKILGKLYATEPHLILLTSQELVPYELWDCFPSYREKYISGVDDLSMATVQKHLRPSDLRDIKDHLI